MNVRPCSQGLKRGVYCKGREGGGGVGAHIEDELGSSRAGSNGSCSTPALVRAIVQARIKKKLARAPKEHQARLCS